MNQFDQTTLENLKKLCRIQCTPEEDEQILHSLQRVLGYIRLLDEVDTKGVATCRFVLKGMLKNVMRDDEPKNLLSREQFLANAPDQVSGLVRIPPILKGL